MKKQLILLHGALGHQGDFHLIKPLLSEKFEVYCFNFSGHGQEPFSTHGFGIESFAKELEEFIDENSLHKPSVFGYSMGGYVALYLATVRKEILGQVLTLGTKFAWTPENADKETSRMNPEVMAEKIPAFTNALLSAHGDTWKTLVEQTAGMMIELGESPLLTPATLSSIEIPIHICRGQEDQMVAEEESRNTANLIPDAKYTELPKTKHPIQTVDLGLLTDIISNCL